MASDLRKRAELGQLWYDDLRRKMQEIFPENLDDAQRTAFIYDMYTQAAGDMRDINSKLSDLVELPDPQQVEFWNSQLPAPLAKSGLLDSLIEQTQHLMIYQVDPAILGEYARYAMGLAIRELVNGGSPAEVMVSDWRLIDAVLNSKRRREYETLDLWHVPFPRCWWEFSKPVEIAGIKTHAVAFFADPENGISCAALLQKSPVNWNERGFTCYLGQYIYGLCGGVRTSSVEGTYKIADENKYLSAIGRLWDFVTSRNLDYELVKRKRSRVSYLEKQYTHSQGKNAVVRQVFTLGMNRTIKLPEDPEMRGGQKGSDWGHQIYVPGAFHRWVYCDNCGDVHRHDLIGQPCRDCGKEVGPRKNIRVEKYWHAPHFKGPKDAPVKPAIRQVKK